jgi:hypothetical protein
VERRNQTVMATARCMMKTKSLPSMFWGEAVNCDVYLMNRTMSKSTGGKTPFELWIGSKPVVSHLRVFGCIVLVKNTRPNLKKLEDRSKPMVFVGYVPGSATYRCYDPNTKCVCISRDVFFDEEGVWKWAGEQATEMDSEFIIEGGD